MSAIFGPFGSHFVGGTRSLCWTFLPRRPWIIMGASGLGSQIFLTCGKKTGWFLEYIPPSQSNRYFVTKVYSSNHSFLSQVKKSWQVRVYILLWDYKKYFFTSKIYFPDKILLWLISWVPPPWIRIENVLFLENVSQILFLWQEVKKQRLVKFLKMVYVKTELTRLMTNLFTSLLKVVADTDKRVRYPSSQDCFQNDFLTEWSWFKIILDPHCGMRIAPYSRLTLKTGRSETATRQIKQELQRGNSWRLKSKNIINEANDKPVDHSLEVDTDKTLLPSSLCHSDPSYHFTPQELVREKSHN